MRNILPEPIRIKGRVGSLFPFFVHGLKLERNVLENCLQNVEAGWQKYVRAEWVYKNWENIFSPPQDGAQALFPWLCVSFDAWNNLSNIQN
jgi:hypothetical protein